MSTLKDLIAAETALLPKLVPTPLAPFFYGTDLSCTSDLDARMRETNPESPEGIVEACIRFLTTDRDSIPDAPNRGWNVIRLLNRGTSLHELREGEGQVMNELNQDDRIDRSEASLSYDLSTERLVIRFRIFPERSDIQPFDYVFAVDQSGAVFLGSITQ